MQPLINEIWFLTIVQAIKRADCMKIQNKIMAIFEILEV